MAANYVLLERIELNADASSVSFTNIPQSGYTDLLIKVSSRQTNASIGLKMAINGYSSFSGRVLEGSGSSASSYTMTTQLLAGYNNSSAYTASTFASTEIYIPNYTSTTNKSVSADTVTETNGTTAYSALFADLYTTSSPITTITFTADNSGSIASGSTFSLYGLAAVGTTPAIAPKASGGNITTDGTYWYHAFRTTGAFVPQTGLTCDILTVAGGGSGPIDTGAGAGAGGVLYNSSVALTTTSYTATVGAGGGGNANGSNSSINSFIAIGGGKGAGDYTGGPGNGGSGGGGGNPGGTGTAGQGNNGGASGGAAKAGGGGAGAVGQSTTSGTSTGGNGGAGVNTYSSWLTAIALTGTSGFIGGGGGGMSLTGSTNGSGGAGGGGSGINYADPTSNGTPNTGGGGGSFGTGGSGIIIVRYLAA